jgi:hypothetical protein
MKQLILNRETALQNMCPILIERDNGDWVLCHGNSGVAWWVENRIPGTYQAYSLMPVSSESAGYDALVLSEETGEPNPQQVYLRVTGEKLSICNGAEVSPIRSGVTLFKLPTKVSDARMGET